MRILAISNQKGGCGKTTTSINLAASLSFLGKKVLLIDLDPQAHATIGLGVKSDELERSMFDVLNPQNPDRPHIQDITVQPEKNLWLAPAQIVLAAIEQQLAGLPKREEQLHMVLTGLERRYDFVLIDCPPNLGLLTFNALRAADEVVITIEPSSFSIQGLDRLNETIQLLKEKVNHHLFVHALMTMYDNRKRFIREIVDQVRLLYDKHVLRTVIRNNIRLREAACVGRPMTRFDRHSTGFHDYLNLASEIIERGSWARAGVLPPTETQTAVSSEEAYLAPAPACELESEPQTEPEFGIETDAEPAELSETDEISEIFAQKTYTPSPEHAYRDAGCALEPAQPATALVKEEIQAKTGEAVALPARDEPQEVPAAPLLQKIKGIKANPLKVSGGYLFICKSSSAKTVQLVGDFTNWVPMTMNSPGGSTGFWTRIFSLKPGRYKYKFVVDGEWVIDVNNQRMEHNPYGGIDSVLELV